MAKFELKKVKQIQIPTKHQSTFDVFGYKNGNFRFSWRSLQYELGDVLVSLPLHPPPPYSYGSSSCSKTTFRMFRKFRETQKCPHAAR